MQFLLFVIVLLATIGCRREVADLGDLRHERIIFSNDEKFEGIEIAQAYLESITKPLLSRDIGREEVSFFEKWEAFGRRCDLWSYITRYRSQPIKEARLFVVSMSIKRKGQSEIDSSTFGERMLGVDGKMLVPVIKHKDKYIFDQKARMPGQPRYRQIRQYQQSIESFISSASYCFPDAKT